MQVCPDIGPFIFYVDAFNELSTCRQSGMGIGKIPFTAIHEYAKIYNIEDFQSFNYLIRVMDNKVIKLSDKKSKDDGNGKQRKVGNAKNKVSRG